MQHLIHDNYHHYKLSINPHIVGVVLLERKDLQTEGLIVWFFFQIARGAKECNREFTMIVNIL